ncbi:MAG: TlpA family protein disulfide reductase [Phycisphaeraceae bacterium]|nr:MAG: TlpA family protein disulfide reductase [Phycisphaeraceae bacterium]
MRPLALLVSMLILVVSPLSVALSSAAERYELDLQTPGGPLPVLVDVTAPPRVPRCEIVFRNGGEDLHAEVVSVQAGADADGLETKYTVRIPGFASTLEWTVDKDAEGEQVGSGQWVTQRRNGEAVVPLVVRRGPSPPAAGDLARVETSIRSGRYHVRFGEDTDPAIGIFDIKPDGSATGTFLTPTGDFRYLAGSAAGNTLRLSCFDGAHAFLFKAERQDNGTLKGDFWAGNWWHDTWSAEFDPGARLPDPFEQTAVVGTGAQLESLVFRNLDGDPTPVSAIAPPGTPRVIIVFGSWCPNCHDETALLTELDKKYGPRGLLIAGLAFEYETDPTAAGERVRQFAKDMHVDYPLLIAGVSDKGRATEALPVLDKVRAMPTTMFIDGEGVIRAVYTGFSGPATGSSYDRLRHEFTTLIESMLPDRAHGPED